MLKPIKLLQYVFIPVYILERSMLIQDKQLPIEYDNNIFLGTVGGLCYLIDIADIENKAVKIA